MRRERESLMGELASFTGENHLFNQLDFLYLASQEKKLTHSKKMRNKIVMNNNRRIEWNECNK